jgi:hypothetical protein
LSPGVVGGDVVEQGEGFVQIARQRAGRGVGGLAPGPVEVLPLAAAISALRRNKVSASPKLPVK